MTSQNSYVAVIAATLLSVGCTTPAPTIQPDTPPQKGAALIGWAFSVPGAPHMVFIGTTSRNLVRPAAKNS